MQFKLKDYLKISILYTFAASFPAFLQIFILPVIEGNGRLGAVDFSQLSIAESISTFVAAVILFSMNSAISRFYYDCTDDHKKLSTLFSSILAGVLFRGLLFVGIGIVFGNLFASQFTQPELQNFSTYGYGAIATGINRSVILVVVTLYRNQKRIAGFMLVNIAVALLRAAGQLTGLFVFKMSFTTYVNGGAVGGAIVTLVTVIYMLARTGFVYDKRIMRSVYLFATPLFTFEMVKWGVTFIDRFILESTPEQLGIYDNAQRFASGLVIIFQGLYGALQPDFFQYLKSGVQTSLSDLRRLTNIYVLQVQVIAIGLILPVITYIYLFFETSLSESGSLIAIIFSQSVLVAVCSMFSLPIIFNKRTGLFLFVNLAVLFVSIVLNYFLIPRLGYYGAIIASYSANMIQLALFMIIQNKIYPISWNYRKIVVIPTIIISFAIAFEFVKTQLVLNYVLISFIYVFLVFCLIIILYRKEAKQILDKIINR